MDKEKFDQTSKKLKILWPRLSAEISFCFLSLLTAAIVKNCHILAGFLQSFQKNVLDQTSKAFNTTFRTQ